MKQIVESMDKEDLEIFKFWLSSYEELDSLNKNTKLKLVISKTIDEYQRIDYVRDGSTLRWIVVLKKGNKKIGETLVVERTKKDCFVLSKKIMEVLKLKGFRNIFIEIETYINK